VSERLLDLPAVTAKTTLSRSTVYSMIALGRFPAPLKVAAQTVRWRESAIEAWIDSLKTTTETKPN
jgi:prophage regulatory protein